MKKFWWLVLIPFFMTKVLASEVYYSEYTDFSEYQEEKVVSSDTVNVEEIRMYKWHKWVKELGEYKPYNSLDHFTDDCYETNYSDWSNSKPNITEATILDEKVVHTYQMIQPIRYIHLYNVHGSYGSLRVPELQVFIDDSELEYTYTCNGCLKDFDKYIHNGIYLENNSYIENNGHLIIDLGKEYPINKIKLIFYVFDMGNDTKTYTLGYSKDKDDIVLHNSYSFKFASEYYKDAQRYEYEVALDNSLLSEYVTDEEINNEFVFSKETSNKYRYKEKLCRKYTLKKEYYPYYSPVSVEDYVIDDDEKVFYRYQTRDKLELSMHNITERNYDLNNFIIDSSGTCTITDNIDWAKNGVYNVEFKLNDISVSKQVNVMLLDNSLKEKDEEIASLKLQIQQTISEYEKIISNIENEHAEYLKKLNEFEEFLNSVSNDISLLKGEQDDIDILLNDLNNKIKNYEDDISELRILNQNNQEQLEVIFNYVSNLNDKVKRIEADEELSTLQKRLDEICNEYDEKIDLLQKLNTDNVSKILEINLELDSIKSKLKDSQAISDDRYNEINTKIESIDTELKDLVANINSKGDIENKILDYEKKITILNSEIDRLKIEINNINNKLKTSESYQKDSYSELNTKVLKLTEKEKIYNESIDTLSNKIESINEQRTGGYLLKIDTHNIVNLWWLYLLLIALLIAIIILNKKEKKF